MTTETKNLDPKNILWTNLNLLGINSDYLKEKYGIDVFRDSFDAPNNNVSCGLMYEICSCFNSQLCSNYFNDVWPIKNKIMETNFKRLFLNFVDDLSKKYPDLGFPEGTQISNNISFPTYGVKFHHYMTKLTSCLMLYQIQTIEEDLSHNKSIKRTYIPEFLFPEGYSHKMFIAYFVENCQLYCNSIFKNIIDLSKYRNSMIQFSDDLIKNIDDKKTDIIQRIDAIINNERNKKYKLGSDESRININQMQNDLDSFSDQIRVMLTDISNLFEDIYKNNEFLDNSSADKEISLFTNSKVDNINQLFECCYDSFKLLDQYLSDIELDTVLGLEKLLANWGDLFSKQQQILNSFLQLNKSTL